MYTLPRKEQRNLRPHGKGRSYWRFVRPGCVCRQPRSKRAGSSTRWLNPRGHTGGGNPGHRSRAGFFRGNSNLRHLARRSHQAFRNPATRECHGRHPKPVRRDGLPRAGGVKGPLAALPHRILLIRQQAYVACDWMTHEPRMAPARGATPIWNRRTRTAWPLRSRGYS